LDGNPPAPLYVYSVAIQVHPFGRIVRVRGVPS
jgi:hypothetical protein